MANTYPLRGWYRRIAELTTVNVSDPGLGNESDSPGHEATDSAFAQINDVQVRVGALEEIAADPALIYNPFAQEAPALVDKTSSVVDFEYQMAADDYRIECKAALHPNDTNLIILPVGPNPGIFYRISKKADSAMKGSLRVGLSLESSFDISNLFTIATLIWDGVEWKSPGNIIERFIALTAAEWYMAKITEDAIDIPANWASKTITCDGVLENDTVTVGGTTATFKAQPLTALHVLWTTGDNTANAEALAHYFDKRNGHRADHSNGVVTVWYPIVPTITTSNGTRLAVATVAGQSNEELDTRLQTAETNIGSLQNVSTVQCASVVAGDELSIVIDDDAPVVLTAIAYDGTPAAGEFCVGETLDSVTATNLGDAIADLQATTLAKLTGVTVNSATVQLNAAYTLVLSASTGDEAKLVCLNNTNADGGGDITQRLAALEKRIVALETA